MSGRKSKVDPQEIESARRKCDVLQKNLAQCVGQVNKFNTTLRRSQLTLEELANLPASAHTYKTIGRTFIMAPMNEIIEDLQLTIAECKKSAEAGIV